ncbi:MAG: AMP-binding protein [Lachnoclostridium edouardi]|uniref:AMP-binding protein n=1 Tax=Lachnoclostridium edouardi TaxID=1926283 RepID=UPI0026DDC468|nr:AMP-binding protein [Lachnoclostridium edouardi]MDO4278918.1 AMP-binding protein [Lachnoclostridium edouardi]
MITCENTKTIYDLVQNAAKEYKDKVFLRYEENDVVYQVSYREFASQCEAVAAWTKAHMKKEGRKIKVGLFGGSSYHYLAVLLGVMSSGSTGVPLDIQMNVSSLKDCLNRSDIDILFYDWEHRALIDGVRELCPDVKEYISLQHGKHVPCSHNILKEFAGQKSETKAEENDCAMILFTSGTTGRGKGVMLSNKNLIHNTFCTTDTDHPERETYLNILPIHHVFCLNGDIFIVMRYGSTLCLNQDMSKLAAHIQLFQPSVIRMVPMVAKALYNKIRILKQQKPYRPIDEICEEVLGKRLHKIISGGGYLAPDLAENYRELGISIAQGYGMSECSPKISAPDWSRPDKIKSVGKVVDGCQVRIVDGEIQVKSPSVMMGYYKEPEKTAEVLSEDGWLSTGDLGYIDEENFLYLTGRKKNLIILSNGENVAPEQLENMFEDEGLIEDILVFGQNDMITAEIYPRFQYAEAAEIQNIEEAVGEIIKKHNQDLPSYKRIMRWSVRDTPFEKTSSKKIIRSRYFDEKKQEEELLLKMRMPENELQQKIYDSASEALGHSRFGIDTDLYEAGLDSLGSVMFLADLYEKLKMSMSLNDLMLNSTIEKLENLFLKGQNTRQKDFTVRKTYPLTNLQLFFAYVMRGNTTANLPFLFRLHSSVDLNKLKKAVEDVFDAHPGLKAVVQMEEGAYKNFRYDEKRINFPIIYLSDEQWRTQQKSLLKPYTYEENEPLYHGGIYVTESANYFFLDIAHIMGDGMTMNIIFEDINKCYGGQQVEKEEYTFFEYILDEKDKDKQGLRKENEQYFKELMQDFKIKKSILNRKECFDLTKGHNAVLKERFQKLNRKKITAFCKKYGVSENVMFLTAFNYCIGIFSNEMDTVSTSIHSGRTDSRWNRLAGPLFLTYYFRCRRIPHETVPQLLQRSGKQIMDTMRCYISNLHADEMFFQYQGDILNINQIGGMPAEKVKIQLDSLPFHLQVMSDEKGYYYELRYWENRFDKDQLKIFMICLETILQAMLEEPSARRLKKYLPENVFPKHYFIKARDVNLEAGSRLIPNIDENTKVKAYIFDESCRKQPFGAWGSLYIMDCETHGYTDKITNPYGPGILYQTGKTARILPDGSIDMLEKGGRTIMSEGIAGRYFLDLHKLEKALLSFNGIEKAEAYIYYGENNKLILTADIFGSQKPDMEKVKIHLENYCEKWLIPGEIRFFTAFY